MVASRPSVSVISTSRRLGPLGRSVARKPISRSSSPRKMLLLSVTSTSPGAVAEPLRRRGTRRWRRPPGCRCRRRPAAALRGQVGDQRDDRDARRDQPRRPPRRPRGTSGALSSTPCEPRRRDAGRASRPARRPAPVSRRWNRARTTAGPQRRQLGLQRRADGGGEPLRGLHDDVDEERAAGRAGPGSRCRSSSAMACAHLGGRARADAAAAVEHAVDRRLAEAGLAAISRMRNGWAIGRLAGL